MQYGWCSPGPTKYKLAASVGGKQPDGRKPDPPVWGMGKPGSRFLYGYATGQSLETAGKMGCAAAAEVIGHYGARPEIDVKALFAERGLI